MDFSVRPAFIDKVKVFIRFDGKEKEVPVDLCQPLFSDPVIFNFFIAGAFGFEHFYK